MPSIVVKVARAARRADDTPPRMVGVSHPIYAANEWQYFTLQEDLQALGSAACLPMEYVASTNSWRFLRTLDSYGGLSKCPVIQDIVGYFYGITGEGIIGRFRWLGSAGGTIEALSHGKPTHEGKLDGALNAGSTATFSIYSCATGSWVDTTTNLTVHAPPRLSSGSIDTGKWARVYYDLTRPGWTVDSAEC